MQLRESFPLRTYLGLSLLGVGFGVVGAVSGAAIASGSSVASGASVVHIVAPQLELTRSSGPAKAEPPSDQIGFVIASSTGNWFVLPIDGTKLAHRAGQLEDHEGIQRVVEPILARDLTPSMRAWRDVPVTVDGSCLDTLHDFALISQLAGDPAYAGASSWTTAQVQADGQTYVVAKLAHCAGTYARATHAPPMIAFTKVDKGAHLAKAEQQALSSELARQVKAAFFDQNRDSADLTRAWTEAVQVRAIEVTDPRTGTNWVSVHVSGEFSCGALDVNFYDLYRVDRDELVTVSEMKTENLATIDALVDVDGDGVPELLGSGWLEPTHAFYSSEMEPLVSYELPFFGCPC